MKTVTAFPPNYSLIKSVLNPPAHAAFTYGDTIYNPCGRELPPDITYHESVHSKQQGDDPESWWNRYLSDSSYRLAQEVEAYGEQYAFACRHVSNNKLRTWAKESMALALSSEAYGGVVSFSEAESLIRRYAKNKATV
jgi:hypothetical protein